MRITNFPHPDNIQQISYGTVIHLILAVFNRRNEGLDFGIKFPAMVFFKFGIEIKLLKFLYPIYVADTGTNIINFFSGTGIMFSVDPKF